VMRRCPCTGPGYRDRRTQSAVHTQAFEWCLKQPQVRLMPIHPNVGESRMSRCSGLCIQAWTVQRGVATPVVPHASVSPPREA
jgi:hypothetical protein